MSEPKELAVFKQDTGGFAVKHGITITLYGYPRSGSARPPSTNEELIVAMCERIQSLDTQLADATRKLEEASKDAERLDFMWERQVTMYDQHPNYMPMCICFDDGTGERVTIVAQNLREAIDKAIEQGKGGDDAKN
jgi:hypothetical protein